MRGRGAPDTGRGTAPGLFGLPSRAPRRRHRSLFGPTHGRLWARRWRAADGGPCRQRPAAEESPRSGKHGVGREPDGRESELRSRNDTARWDGEGGAPEIPSGYGETADSPGASPDRRDEPFPRPSRRARSRMLPETERGLLPRPGRHVRKLACRRPGNSGFRAGNLGDFGRLPCWRSLSSTLPVDPFDSPTIASLRRRPPGSGWTNPFVERSRDRHSRPRRTFLPPRAEEAPDSWLG